MKIPKLQPTVDWPADERAFSMVISCGTMPAMPITAASIEMVAISVVIRQWVVVPLSASPAR